MGKCCLKSVISIAIIVVILVVSVVVVLNMTPTKLGLADKEVFSGKTIRELGLADTSVLNIIRSLKGFINPPTDDIVKNGYDQEDEQNAESNFENSNLPQDGDGDINYVSVATSEVIYDNEYLLTYSDTTIAYIFHSIVNDVSEDTSDDGLAFLKQIKGDIEEVTITKEGDQTDLRIIVSVDLTPFKTQIQNALGSLASFFPLPNTAYIVSYSTMSADENGIITTTSQSLKINDTDNALSQAIFSVLAQATENAGVQTDEEFINSKVGDAFSLVIKNLGKVGTASVDTSGIVQANTKNLGTEGISNHQLTLITNTTEIVE
ncbi:MAG TPA: hypothetical protein VJ903_04535 [Clostridia bacterium]|nr:hypothetical protein [Clostridia bacterium]